MIIIMLALFKIRGFYAYLSVLFLNAFVDLGHKIIIQNTVFKTYDGGKLMALTATINALILLPYVLLFVPSGFLSDKYPKNKVMRFSAWVAVGLTLMITLAYYQGWFWFGFAMTFMLAIQSAIYAPSKYGYLKELVGEKQLTAGNGAVQAGTMIAILAGTFVFSVLFEHLLSTTHFPTGNLDKNLILEHIAPLGWILVALTLFELVNAYRVPQKAETKQAMKFNWGDFATGKTAKADLKFIWNHKTIWLTIVGLSLFWAVSQVILASFPTFAKDHLALTDTGIVNGITAFAVIGIMLGSFWVARISKNTIETGLIPLGAAGLTLSVFLITQIESPTLHAINFLFMGIMGSFFVIPLRTLMQYHTDNAFLGRVIASNNLVQNITMLSFLGITIALAKWGLDSQYFFLILAVVLVVGAGYTVYKLPQSLIRFIISRLISFRYRTHVINFDNIPANGGVLLLGNHISWLDWAMIQIASPRQLHFVMSKTYYNKWYLKRFLDLFGVVPIGHTASAESLKTVTQLLNDGKAVCLFPEGTISRSGQLNEFKRGYEIVAENAPNAEIIPFYLHGLWGSRFSYSEKLLRENRKTGWKRDIIIAFGEAISINTPHDELKRIVTEVSLTAWQHYTENLPSLSETWIRNSKKQLSQDKVCETSGQCLNAAKFMTAVFRFAHLIKKESPEQNIGILLPATIAGSITNMAVMTLGKTIINLNYTASKEALQGAVILAEIKTVYTSKKFLEKLKQRNIDMEAILDNTRLIYLEDLKPKISKASMLSTLLQVYILPASLLSKLYVKKTKPEQTAAILFSSGSEGLPKGIELSHKNLTANARQVANVLNPDNDDKIVSTLPTFHAFGLLATTLMPLSEGIPILCHPDPTDVLNIAKGVARFKATFLFGTSTFFRMYAQNKKIHPLMLESLKFAVAGAEKLKPEVREMFTLKFNKSIMEGYGATETSPVASVNLPDYLDTNLWKLQQTNKQGTVGHPLPGTALRIVDPDTMESLKTDEDGLILIAGPQVMKGYLNHPEKTLEAITEIDGQHWYKTGDKGHLDKDGFLTIVDRYSRFAKVGGEMISLTAVETQVSEALEDVECDMLAVALPDKKKGEKIILLIAQDIKYSDIKKALRKHQVNPLMQPAQSFYVENIPRLGSGKPDFSNAKKLAEALVG
jgi:acyl-[acyl-carrier-protein]-phospholipid O-acyltransferase/long-chain-fatty-acid--[acyl-carrier-protein] ligase